MTNVTVTFWLEGVLLPVISVFGLIGKLDLQYNGIYIHVVIIDKVVMQK